MIITFEIRIFIIHIQFSVVFKKKKRKKMKMRFFFSPKIGVKNSKFNSSWTEVIKIYSSISSINFIKKRKTYLYLLNFRSFRFIINNWNNKYTYIDLTVTRNTNRFRRITIDLAGKFAWKIAPRWATGEPTFPTGQSRYMNAAYKVQSRHTSENVLFPLTTRDSTYFTGRFAI